MVKLHVKRGDESQFLYETTAITPIHDLAVILANIYNGRLKIERICQEIENLSKYGIAIPPNVQDEQIQVDVSGRREDKAPNEQMAQLLSKLVDEATCAISVECVSAEVCLTRTKISEILELLRDTVLVVYPMGLPPYDPIQQEFDNNERLSSDQQSKIIGTSDVRLWWAGKPLQMDKLLSDYIGKNEKTKIIVKIQKKDQGPPSREPLMGEEMQKQLMLHAYRRQEELKRIEDDDDNYLNAQWADKQNLKKSFHGVGNISWRPN